MRQILKLALLLITVLLLVTASASAAKKARKPKGGAAGPKVVVTAKTVLRAEPSPVGKALGKLKPKAKLDFVKRSPDGKWAQVKKGKVAGWVLVDELSGVPEAVASAPVQQAPVQQAPPPDSGIAPVRPQEQAQDSPEMKPVMAEPAQRPQPAEPAAQTQAVEQKPASEATQADAPPARPVAPKTPLAGWWFSLGGGTALLGTKFTSQFKNPALEPEFYRYDLFPLPSVGIQLRGGYTFGWKALRVGVDGAGRLSAGGVIVTKLPDIDGQPRDNGIRPELAGSKQEIPVIAADGQVAASIGGYFGLGKKLEMSLRARGGFQGQLFRPEFNSGSVLPQEALYGVFVGGMLDLQTRSAPGFGLRLEGGYIPFAVREQNPNARDAVCPARLSATDPCEGSGTSAGFNVGGSLAFRVIQGFDIELGYHLLWTWTDFPRNSLAERLKFDRDDVIKTAATRELLDSARRDTIQHTIVLGIAFRR